MSFLRHAEILGGKLEPQPNSTHVVSAWVLPFGYDASRAQVALFFFESEAPANYVAKQYHSPPEMAFVMTLEQYTQVAGLVPALATCVCQHCGASLTRFEINNHEFWVDESNPVMGTKQYCWVDPALGSQRHKPQ